MKKQRLTYEDIPELVGRSFTRIEKSDLPWRSEIVFYDDVNHVMVTMEHNQSCCESVYIDEITGDLQDLVGERLEVARIATKDNPEESYGVGMWTFYTLRSIKGTVDLRWYGSSNGCYSVAVSVEETMMPTHPDFS